jgi:ssDNA thymidine ADP-ribosyltransferase, DarT
LAIALETVREHVAFWVEHFRKSSSPYRRNWPPRLFRHEPVENAALILRTGRLLSRKAAQAVAPRDIADKQIIAAQADAHSYARLYFRPKSPTQYHIEGIRKPSEYYRNDPDTYAPILVIMIFKAEAILATPGVCFSDGNMQSPRTNRLSTDEEFRNLPFAQIYHVGPTDPGSDVIRCRCAEVLVPNQLILDDRLQAVLCRSPAERATLLHMLGDAAERWSQIIRVYTEPGIFESRYAYVDSVAVSGDGVNFKTHARFDAQPVRVDVTIFPTDGTWQRSFFLDEAHASFTIVCNIQLEPGSYLVEIAVDRCPGYKAVSLIEELPF